MAERPERPDDEPRHLNDRTENYCEIRRPSVTVAISEDQAGLTVVVEAFRAALLGLGYDADSIAEWVKGG